MKKITNTPSKNNAFNLSRNQLRDLTNKVSNIFGESTHTSGVNIEDVKEDEYVTLDKFIPIGVSLKEKDGYNGLASLFILCETNVSDMFILRTDLSIEKPEEKARLQLLLADLPHKIIENNILLECLPIYRTDLVYHNIKENKNKKHYNFHDIYCSIDATTIHENWNHITTEEEQYTEQTMQIGITLTDLWCFAMINDYIYGEIDYETMMKLYYCRAIEMFIADEITEVKGVAKLYKVDSSYAVKYTILSGEEEKDILDVVHANTKLKINIKMKKLLAQEENYRVSYSTTIIVDGEWLNLYKLTKGEDVFLMLMDINIPMKIFSQL